MQTYNNKRIRLGGGEEYLVELDRYINTLAIRGDDDPLSLEDTRELKSTHTIVQAHINELQDMQEAGNEEGDLLLRYLRKQKSKLGDIIRAHSGLYRWMNHHPYVSGSVGLGLLAGTKYMVSKRGVIMGQLARLFPSLNAVRFKHIMEATPTQLRSLLKDASMSEDQRAQIKKILKLSRA